jgi:hypothetical protein
MTLASFQVIGTSKVQPRFTPEFFCGTLIAQNTGYLKRQ